MFHNNSCMDDTKTIANLFADYFESVYTNVSPCSRDIVYNHDLNIQYIDITVTEVFNAANVLNLKCGPGADGIPPIFFKSCNYIMSRILWLIFNKSLQCGVFSSIWKLCILGIMCHSYIQERRKIMYIKLSSYM